jgi:Uma2 family endonuclease
MAETGIHVLVMVTLITTLRHYYRHRPDVYVIGNIFFYYEEGNPKARRSPDVMVIKGVDPGPERDSFKTWEERAVPCVVIEVTSQQTADEDQGPKCELYERLGVREYFLFDPLHDYLERPLMGYRLIGEEYEPLPPADDGGLLSAELGVRLVPEGTQLALFRFQTGERLLAPPEAYQLLEETLQRVKQAEERASQAEHRVSQAEERASQAEQLVSQAEQRANQAEQQVSQAEQELQRERQRAEQMAEELARLRALRPPQSGDAGPP